jgi:hypothetical protein
MKLLLGIRISQASHSPSRRGYIGEIAADIMEHLPSEVLRREDDAPERLYEQLPRILKGFAIEPADSSRTRESRDAMVFINPSVSPNDSALSQLPFWRMFLLTQGVQSDCRPFEDAVGR